MKNLTIVGGHGFIGKNLCDFFLPRGFSITLIGKNSGNKEFPKKVKSISANVKDTQAILETLKDAEIVIWLASSLVPGSHENSLQEDFENNIRPVISYLEKADNAILEKFIYLSSGGTVYGDAIVHAPLEENSKKAPISEYGLSKLVTENYIQFITKSSNFESYILRPSNVFGKYQNLNKPQGIIGFAFQSLLNESSINLYDEGKVIRDFIFVSDVSTAILECIKMQKVASKTNIYNLGSGEGYSIKEIISKIGKIAKREVKTISKSSRKFDCEYNVLSIEKIKNELNWKPETDIDTGLEIVWKWINEMEND